MHSLLVLALVTLTAGDGTPVDINPAMVNMVGRPNTEQLHRSVKCVIFLADGKFVSVRESCDEVRQLLGR